MFPALKSFSPQYVIKIAMEIKRKNNLHEIHLKICSPQIFRSHYFSKNLRSRQILFYINNLPDLHICRCLYPEPRIKQTMI